MGDVVTGADVPAAASRPTGTVTFLFTDIEGSTVLWEQHPDAMTVSLARHDQLLRRVIVEHGGFIMSPSGDGFCAAFQRASEAVSAALDAQCRLAVEPWPPGAELRVRMGIHTGETHERDGNYFGRAVSRAARVMGAANGRQVIASVTAVESLGAVDDVELIDLGDVRLRSLDEPVRVYGLAGRGHAWEERPIAASGARSGNVPAPPTALVGRDDVLRMAEAALVDHPTVVLTGPGGIGKTRLAVEIARRVGDQYSDGAWLCELAAVDEPASVHHAVADLFGIRPGEGEGIDDAVVAGLRSRQALLVLDNCEQVLETATVLVRRLSQSCPGMRVLVTSRVAMRLPGAQRIPVPPLDPTTEALDLLRERANASDPTVGASLRLSALVDLCRTLEGVPLAIELAASRLRSMSLEQLASRLDESFRLLRDPGRGVRHETLEATVAWSYDLLTPLQQRLFERASVYPDGFDVDDAVWILADPAFDDVEVLDVVTELVDSSMLQVHRSGTGARYQMLEPLRRFGIDRLATRGELDDVRGLHLERVLGVLASASAALTGNDWRGGNERLDRAWGDLRAAIGWAIESGRLADADRIVADLFFPARWRLLTEPIAWADRAIESARLQGATVGAATLLMSGFGRFLAGDHDAAIKRNLEATRAPGSDREHPHGWNYAAVSAMYLGRMDEAARYAARSVDPPSTDPLTHAMMLGSRAGWLAVTRPRGGSDVRLEVDATIATARALTRGISNPVLDGHLAYAAALGAHAAGDEVDHARHLDQALEIGWAFGVANLVSYVWLARVREHGARGLLAARDALDYMEEHHDGGNELVVLDSVAANLWAMGRAEDAAVLMGYLEHLGVRHGTRVDGFVARLDTIRADPDGARWLRRGAELSRAGVLAHVGSAIDRAVDAVAAAAQEP